jgi:hypothetical protein
MTDGHPILNFKLTRALHDKLAGTEPLPAIIRWWRVAAIDSGYLGSVAEEQLDQLSAIELAASELAYAQIKNEAFRTRALPVDINDELSPWKELEEARDLLRYRRRLAIAEYEQQYERALAEYDQMHARAQAEYAASFDEGRGY